MHPPHKLVTLRKKITVERKRSVISIRKKININLASDNERKIQIEALSISQNFIISRRCVAMPLCPSEQGLERIGPRWVKLAEDRPFRLSTRRRSKINICSLGAEK